MGATTDSMLSSLEATGHIPMTMAMIGDLMDIDHRVKYGDESGWRGDPTMCVCINSIPGHPQEGWFEVWGIDRGGNQYKAASSPKLDHSLLIKLREGDPTRSDPWQKVLDHNAKVKADQEQADREKRADIADKLAWGIRQDFGHLYGGRRNHWHISKGESMDLPKKDGE